MNKKVIIVSCLYIFFLLCTTALFSQNNPVVAVLDFEVHGMSQKDSSALIDSLTAELYKTNKFIVIARADSDKVLQEQEKSLQDIFNQEQQVKMGKLLSAHQVVTGSIRKVGKNIVVNIRLIDVETSKVLQTANGTYNGLADIINDCPSFAFTLAGLSSEINVAGTTWEFELGDTITFLAGGIVYFNKINAKGKWQQKGRRIVFDCNNFTGYDVVIEGNQMKGVWYRIKTPEKTNPTFLTKTLLPDEETVQVKLDDTTWKIDESGESILFFKDGLVVFPRKQMTGSWIRMGSRISIDVNYITKYDLNIKNKNTITGDRHLANNPTERHPVSFTLQRNNIDKSQAPGIEGSTWLWSTKSTVTFLKNGTTQFSHTEYKGVWKQQGAYVEFEINTSQLVVFHMYIFADEMKGILRQVENQNNKYHSDLKRIK